VVSMLHRTVGKGDGLANKGFVFGVVGHGE
jgi:hypothetical protein